MFYQHTKQINGLTIKLVYHRLTGFTRICLLTHFTPRIQHPSSNIHHLTNQQIHHRLRLFTRILLLTQFHIQHLASNNATVQRINRLTFHHFNTLIFPNPKKSVKFPTILEKIRCKREIIQLNQKL